MLTRLFVFHIGASPTVLVGLISIHVYLVRSLGVSELGAPASADAKANPLVTPERIKPEWYFFWAFRWLNLVSDQAAVVTQGLFVGTIISWPLIDACIRRR